MPKRILEVNYFGVVDLLEAWRSALAAAGSSKVVVIASNSPTVTPAIPGGAVAALLAGDAGRAARALKRFGSRAPVFAYAASKLAVSRWVRRQAVTPAWAGAGIRLNAIAPGAVLTPLLEAQLADPQQAKLVKNFPIPVGHYGDADEIAAWVLFMLSPAANSACGSVVFVDGGSDAWFRADDWPRTVPLRAVRHYLRRMRKT
jgi:NAD(P)-dependent dehydrogenase (short-subunit alcohol dehydrogenase family)